MLSSTQIKSVKFLVILLLISQAPISEEGNIKLASHTSQTAQN